MNLKSFQEKSLKSKSIIMIGIFTFVLLIGIIIYQSFAMYEQKMIYNVIQGQVPI